MSNEWYLNHNLKWICCCTGYINHDGSMNCFGCNKKWKSREAFEEWSNKNKATKEEIEKAIKLGITNR